MATFILIPGAGGAGLAYWGDVVADLRRRGHLGVPVEIQADDPALGLPEYAAITDAAIGTHRDVVLVAQSMGGFTAPMVAQREAVRRIVLLNAMIPLPDESPADWFQTTGAEAARRAANAAAGLPAELSIEELFLHDLPPQAVAEMRGADREPAATPFGQPCTFEAWPDVPIHVLVAAEDRMFPATFQQRIARDRLGITADFMPGGHLVARSRPHELVDRLVGYLDA
ncbi:alpha/beta hydrolase [Cumulibacter manganitolerans]|uniref:alpha/beta hydrolase n=1 Tax=Cumulibacter manganitolerans TaxID=1884992 RepID=UPI001297B700|nr:alpha/beta hydrolase [Cumulibacter manganitolerans]